MPEGIDPAAWLPLIEPMSPGAKQVTRPLDATRNCAGHSPLLRLPSPCVCTVNSLPSPLPATPTAIPGISYETRNGFLPWLACIAQSLADFSCSCAAWMSSVPQLLAPVPAYSCNFCWTPSEPGIDVAACEAAGVGLLAGGADLLHALRHANTSRIRIASGFLIIGDCSPVMYLVRSLNTGMQSSFVLSYCAVLVVAEWSAHA